MGEELQRQYLAGLLVKPLFDKKIGVHLDSNMMNHQERLVELKKGLKERDRSKTPNLQDILKKKIQEEKSQFQRELSKEIENQNNLNIKKSMSKLDQKIKALEKSGKSSLANTRLGDTMQIDKLDDDLFMDNLNQLRTSQLPKNKMTTKDAGRSKTPVKKAEARNTNKTPVKNTLKQEEREPSEERQM